MVGQLTDQAMAARLQASQRLGQVGEVTVARALLLEEGLEHCASLCLGNGCVLPVTSIDRLLHRIGQLEESLETRRASAWSCSAGEMPRVS